MSGITRKIPMIDVVEDKSFKALITAYSFIEPNSLQERQEKFKEIKDYILEGYKKIQIANRFFLEEIVHRMKDHHNEDYSETLTQDWLKEFIGFYPLTEEERKRIIKEDLGWDDEFAESAYFESEKALKQFLNIDSDE